MKTKSLFWHLYISYIWIPIIILLMVTLFSCLTFKNFLIRKTAENLYSQAHLLTYQIANKLKNKQFEDIDFLCKDLGQKANTRITIIVPSGKVVGDTYANIESMDNHLDRPEIIDALAIKRGHSIRHSFTLEKEYIYVAIPLFINNDNEPIALIRTSVSLGFINKILHRVYIEIAIGTFFLIILLAIISFWFSKNIGSPLKQMQVKAEKISQGDFSQKINVAKSLPNEITSLEFSINKLANDLDEKIKTILKQKDEETAILENMVEGVLAVGRDLKIIKANKSLSKLIGTNLKHSIGSHVFQTIRVPKIHSIIESILKNNISIDDELEILQTGKTLHIHGTPLSNNNKNSGSLIVFNDITKIKNLEHHRKEFVANVSHELKTPVTAIKGFIETLKDGAIKNENETMEFLDIVLKQTDRLDLIINDLLILSRLEKNQKFEKLTHENICLNDLIGSLTHLFEKKIKQKSIIIENLVDKNFTIKANAHLLEQAMANLIDNAIKYNEIGTKIVISAHDNKDKTINISVEDNGIGIPNEHQNRIFERFYRIDKARSRNMGGTGLGLAIVKHIAEAHNGKVALESIVGQGSKFTISIPEII